MFVSVFIQNNLSRIDKLYTYRCEFKIQRGMRVLVPFGRGNIPKVGLVINVFDRFSEYEVKEVISVIDYEPIIRDDLIELGFWMCDKYLTSPSMTFSNFFPPGDIKEIQTFVALNFNNNFILSNEDREIIDLLSRNSYALDNIEVDKDKIKSLISRNILSIKYKLKDLIKPKKEKYIKLSKNYLEKLSSNKLTKLHYGIIEFLQSAKETSRADLMKKLNISISPINTLANKDIIIVFDKEIYREPYKNNLNLKRPILNLEQKNAFDGILDSKTTANLIHGLTGSGKTEIYLRLSEEIIKRGKQVIVLVPEIGLTPQMIERFRARFKDRVSVLHSKLSQGERYDQWQKIKNSEVDVVVGARSAIFAPFKDLGLIIIDEEHDSSYRFHNSLRYDTIEVAIKRAEILNIKVVLGSATPLVESYYRAKKGEYSLFKLNNRAIVGAKLPDISIVDMREEIIRGNTSIFSSELKNLIEDRLNKKEQIILFLNRRGFSNFVSCRSCGKVIKCKNCDISLTYHKNTNMLRCHYCGYTTKMVNKCPSCGSKFIKQFGVGTQKVEDEVKKLFSDARVLRMDRDTTTKKDSYERVYSLMKNREVDILIGTQMLSKGFDFENVTLVGVLAADLSLYVSDYKAQEITFDLLTQVSGRAGRGDKKGNVIIQTYSPENYSIISAKNNDYIGFYNEEIKLRKEFGYPPFKELVTLEFLSSEDINLVSIAENTLYEIGSTIKDYEILFTRVITMPKIKNIHKVKFTIKVDSDNKDKLCSLIKRVLKEREDKFLKNKVYVNIEMG